MCFESSQKSKICKIYKYLYIVPIYCLFMNIRNVQKTGEMHYVYLPTAWCKKHKIGAGSKVSLDDENSNGTLIVHPHIKAEEEKHIEIETDENSPEVINKLIVACYINPTASFKINLKKEMNLSNFLKQRKLISLESVEIDKREVTCDSTITVSNPNSLLRTMIRKIKNLLLIMIEENDIELMQHYENEIDRSKMLIDKAVIGSFTFRNPSNLNTIDLHYISIISKELERIVDHLIILKKDEKIILKTCLDIINMLKDIVDRTNNVPIVPLDYNIAIDFIKETLKIEKIKIKLPKSHNMKFINDSFSNIADVITDWAITNNVEER